MSVAWIPYAWEPGSPRAVCSAGLLQQLKASGACCDVEVAILPKQYSTYVLILVLIHITSLNRNGFPSPGPLASPPVQC